MPKETFKKLSKEKQERLVSSAIKEFSRVSYDEASINKIIEVAAIPRGSFYMYFNDKEDLYNYIIYTDRQKLQNRIYELLDTYNGDFVVVWENIYDEILNYCNKENRYSFFRNFFLDMRFTSERKLTRISEEEKDKYKTTILSKIDKNLYNIETSEELFDAYMFLQMTTLSSITFRFLNPNLESEKELYRNRLHILKYGLYERKIK